MTRPQIKPIIARSIEHVPTTQLSNGIPVFYFDGAPQEIIKVELLFEAGRWNEKKRQVSKSCARLIKNGTSTKSAHDIQEQIDYLGASIKVSSGYHYISISLFCLLSKLEDSLSILFEILDDSVYAQKELDIYRDKQISRLAVEQEKNEFIADQTFKAHIFGENHPYGYSSKSEDYEALNISLLQDYYNHQINPSNCKMIVSGNVNKHSLDVIDQYLGKKDWSKNQDPIQLPNSSFQHTWEVGKKHVTMADSIQNAIVIGGELFDRKNEDYNSFALLNTVFGGYFGSRLMKNIREEKGFTYGIYSGLQNYKNGATIWAIQTETGNDYLESCIEEIYKEIQIIKTELISDNELKVARNYFMGSMLRRTDGPFSLSSTFKGYLTLGLDVQYFNNLIKDVEQTTTETLINLANKYLNEENFVEVVVGKV